MTMQKDSSVIQIIVDDGPHLPEWSRAMPVLDRAIF
jgi:hypothetical protein